jgi:hypothetical protein
VYSEVKVLKLQLCNVQVMKVKFDPVLTSALEDGERYVASGAY